MYYLLRSREMVKKIESDWYCMGMRIVNSIMGYYLCFEDASYDASDYYGSREDAVISVYW